MQQGAIQDDETGRKLRVRRMRSLTHGMGVAAILMVMLVVISPLAAGTPTAAKSVTLKAPYSGASTAGGGWSAVGCGTNFKTLLLPFFNLTTGVYKSSQNATAKSCGSGNSSVTLDSMGIFETQPFTTTTGNHTVSANWAFSFTVTLAAHSGGAGQRASSYAQLWAWSLLFDNTNGSIFIGGYGVVTYDNTSTPTTHSYALKIICSATFHLVAGHKYSFETIVEVYSYAFASPGKSTASAGVNIGTAGKHATLTSIVIG